MDQAITTPSTPKNSKDIDHPLLEQQRAEIAELVDRHCPNPGKQQTAIPCLTLFRGCAAEQTTCAVVDPVFALIAQGAKRVLVGEDSYDYDPWHYMVAALELPMSSCVTIASPTTPYLGMAVTIDRLKLAELAANMPKTPNRQTVDRGFGIGTLSRDIQGAALRLLRLLDTPEDIPVLAPIIERELLYRLLTGTEGDRLRQSATVGSHSQQILRAVDWLKRHLDQPASVDALADLANMSRSSLHYHFKALTSLTPVQYHKQLRLHEARRLMLSERHDAASAAHRVGYESPSQFSREYRRLFGAPPARDIAGLLAENA